MIDDIDLDHVAVATEARAHAWPRYAGDLAGKWVSGGEAWGFAAGQVRYDNGMKVEVLEPHAVEQNDFLRRYLDRNGPGPHHLTFKVRDIEAAIATATAAGYPPINVDLSEPEWKEAFLHPKSATGVVVQLAQAAGEWKEPPTQPLPPPRTARPATLDHVAHAVASLDDGLALFRDLLGGKVASEGSADDARWVDLSWPGPGRLRLMSPGAAASPLHEWIGGLPGRIHHIAFTTDDPVSVPDARPAGAGALEVPPEANLGTRLVLRSRS